MKFNFKSCWRAVLFATLAPVLLAAAPVRMTPSPDDYKLIFEHPEDVALFDQFLGKLPRVNISEGGTVRTYYLWEGDLLQNREQIRNSIFAHKFEPTPARGPGELRVMAANGETAFWARDHRALTYAVDRSSFPSEAAYTAVVGNMRLAAQRWTTACPPCGLAMDHVAAEDQNPSLDRVTYIVRYDPTVTDFIAAGFFPNDPVVRHFLIIAPSYLTTTFDHVGVLRHEIGHILGYRHEHIVGIPGCFIEDRNWRPLTEYDPHSVMHYFCGGAGTLALDLTDRDIEGHTALYSQP